MQAIILAGGFGTRLQTVVKDVPKPMAFSKQQTFPTLHICLPQRTRYKRGCFGTFLQGFCQGHESLT